MHINYVPNEYESMLVAAGWVDAGDLDSDYLDYVAKDDEPMSYQQWVSRILIYEKFTTPFCYLDLFQRIIKVIE